MKKILQSMDGPAHIRYTKFWTVVFALLITVFPNSPSVRLGYHVTQNSVLKNAPILAEAFKEKDASPIAERMCANIQRNHPDLTEQLQTMLNLIEGDVQTTSWELASGPVSADQDKICQAKVVITILADHPYRADICWEIMNEDHMEEAGIKALALSGAEDDAGETPCLFEIRATEGVYAWES